MTALVGIACDGCERRLSWTQVTQASIGPIREEGRKRGWHKRRGEYETANGYTYGYTRDICPACWAEGKR